MTILNFDFCDFTSCKRQDSPIDPISFPCGLTLCRPHLDDSNVSNHFCNECKFFHPLNPKQPQAVVEEEEETLQISYDASEMHLKASNVLDEINAEIARFYEQMMADP